LRKEFPPISGIGMLLVFWFPLCILSVYSFRFFSIQLFSVFLSLSQNSGDNFFFKPEFLFFFCEKEGKKRERAKKGDRDVSHPSSFSSSKHPRLSSFFCRFFVCSFSGGCLGTVNKRDVKVVQ